MEQLMGKEIRVNVGALLMIFVLLAAPLLYTQSATVQNVLLLLLVLCNANLLGAAILRYSALNANILSLSHSALSVLLGSVAFSLLLFVSAAAHVQMIIHGAFFIIFLFITRKHMHWSVSPGMPGGILFLLAICVLALLSKDDIDKQFSAVQLGTQYYPTDSYFFTAIVSTIRQGTIFSASFEVGSPLNYQTFAFFIPALWANVLGISSHQALWGLALPFYKLLIVLFSYEVFFFFSRDWVKRGNILFLLCAVGFPLLLAPLHPGYIIKGDVRNFIFNGMGYLIPTGTIAYPITIAFFLVCMLLFYVIDWKQRKVAFDKVFFAIMLSVMMVGKLQLHFAFLIFLGTIILKRILLGKERLMSYLPYGVLSIVLSVIYFKILMGQPSGEHVSIQYGYLTEAFAKWYNRSKDGVVNNLFLLALIAAVYIMWMGIRLLGLFADARARVAGMNDLAWGSLVSLLGTTIFALLVRMKMQMDDVVVDMTFNAEQFVRSSFYIITIAASIGILYILFSGQVSRTYRNITGVIVTVWCFLALLTTYHYTYIRQTDNSEMPWYSDNYMTLKSGKLDDGLIVVNPRSGLGIMLASSDYGRYWSAMDRGEGSYNCSLKNTYRWDLFKKLINEPQEKYLSQMRSEGVKYIISTRFDTAQIANISSLYPQLIYKMPGTKWVYELN